MEAEGRFLGRLAYFVLNIISDSGTSCRGSSRSATCVWMPADLYDVEQYIEYHVLYVLMIALLTTSGSSALINHLQCLLKKPKSNYLNL